MVISILLYMGKWAEQQGLRREIKERDEARREALAKYYFNLSQLAFVGLVIGVVIPLYSDVQDATNWYAVLTGCLMTIIFALIGNKILK